MTLMQRRRALMAQNGEGNMVPGKIISIDTSFSNGSQVSNVLNMALSSAGITVSGAAFTTKKQSTWDTRECVGFIINNGTVSTVHRRNGNSIQQLGSYDQRYDISASAGQTFFVLEAVQ